MRTIQSKTACWAIVAVGLSLPAPAFGQAYPSYPQPMPTFEAPPARPTPAAKKEPKPEANIAALENAKVMADWDEDELRRYREWSSEVKVYFWSLSEDRQAQFWALADKEKTRIAKMSPADRERTWKTIER